MYNENDPFALAWLTRLQERNLIPGGSIDGRSISELRPEDCDRTSHFFAGIGGWAYALQLAGWDPTRDVWTGSCPCQPFSIAGGSAKGFSDERHLWPVWRDLIAQCRPATIFGEQVASKLGREWLSGVRDDLEALGYAVGAADLCAASVGAPHRRQRLYWVAHTIGIGRGRGSDENHPRKGGPVQATGPSSDCGNSPETWPTPDTVAIGDGTDFETQRLALLERRKRTKAAVKAGKTKAGSGRSMTLQMAAQSLSQVSGTDMTSPSAEPSMVAPSTGALNPAFPQWLMGYPAAWDVFEVTETP